MNRILQADYQRYPKHSDMPAFQKYYRKVQASRGGVRIFYKCCLWIARKINCIELSENVEIGGGLYIGHPYAITVNPHAKIGRNCNIHKGVTIGQENRGKRKGAPTIGNEVWIGVNATIVGNITIGDDVLIAPNCYVNCDIPAHSVVFGNPCIIKPREQATEGYINRKA